MLSRDENANDYILIKLFQNKSKVHLFNTSRVYFFYKRTIEFGMDKISFLKTENLKRQC